MRVAIANANLLCPASTSQVVLAAAAVGRGAWSHVPYRTCKLTHVLKDCLGGNCATLLVANVWGEAAQLEETLSTCRWEFQAGIGRLAAVCRAVWGWCNQI